MQGAIAMKQASKTLEESLHSFMEGYEEALSDAVERENEGFLGSIEALVEEFGAHTVSDALRYYTITVLPNSLEDAFGPIEPSQWQDEE
jgi:hypothetical protein